MSESLRDPEDLMLQAFIPPVWLAGCTCTTSNYGLLSLHSDIFFCFMQKWAQFSLTPFFCFPGVACVAKQCMAELFQGEPKFPRTTGQVRAHFRLERRIQYKIKSVRGCRSSRTASQFIIFKNYSKQKHIVILNRQTSLKNNKN